MIREGPGKLGGMTEAIELIEHFGRVSAAGGSLRALAEGDTYAPLETLLLIEAPIQSIVALETVYLGVLSAGTTRLNGGPREVDLTAVTRQTQAVVEAAGGRPVMYFGARHWHYHNDASIAQAAFAGGASSCSTLAGAATAGQEAVGTIPHVLENIMAWRFGTERAVVEAALAFDRVIDPTVPRVALIDYANREIEDSLVTAAALGSRLWGVRVDTCGENRAEGALASPADSGSSPLFAGVKLPSLGDPDARFWYGNGVTITGVYALRRTLDEAGFGAVRIVLSSGFADPVKVRAFARAEERLGTRLFDALGVGGLYESRSAKMDIVGVGETLDQLTPIAKAGRGYRPNPRLQSAR